MKFLTNGLIAISIVFLGFCSYYLYKELTSRVENTGGEAIGTIVFKKKSASRKYTNSVIWEEIAQESEIYNYDAIRTMEYSSAVLTLKDGTKIELDQNTMLVVIMTDKALSINFDKGGVTAQNGSGSMGSIMLNSKDASISLSNGDISVRSDDAGVNVRLNSGTAKFAAGGKELDIASNDVATLKGGVAESGKEKITPEFPARNSYLLTFDKTKSVNFSWRSSIPGEVNVEVSLNSMFQPVYKKFKTGKTNYEMDLPAGDYYWRIVKDNSISYPVKFSIISDNKLELNTPLMNQKLTLSGESRMVTFRWSKSKYAVNYEVTAARNKDMTDIVLNLTSRVNTISTDKLDQGVYYWNVKSIYSPGVITGSTITGANSFSIEKGTFPLLRPVLLDQGNVTTGYPFTLHWKGVQGAKKYKVDIASDEDFAADNIITSKITGSSFVRIDDKLSEGKYFWRVSALNGDKISESSETSLLTVTKPVEITPLYPAEGAVLYDKPENINFSWSDPNRGDNYIVEISERKDFRNIKESRKSTSSGLSIKSPGEGVHYWRVVLRDKSGSAIAQSSISNFIIPSELKAPVLIAPKNNEKITPGVKKRLKLQWSKVDGVSEYEVEIFQHIAGIDKSLTIYTVKTAFIELSNQMLYKPGQFSWLVRARKIKGGKVTAYKESKKSFFEIVTVVLLPAPVVKTPPIIFNGNVVK